jgi:hypothetical protein
MNIQYLGFNYSGSNVYFFRINGVTYSASQTSSTVYRLTPFTGQLPTLTFPNSWRITDSDSTKLVYTWEGINYVANWAVNDSVLTISNSQRTESGRLPGSSGGGVVVAIAGLAVLWYLFS